MLLKSDWMVSYLTHLFRQYSNETLHHGWQQMLRACSWWKINGCCQLALQTASNNVHWGADWVWEACQLFALEGVLKPRGYCRICSSQQGLCVCFPAEQIAICSHSIFTENRVLDLVLGCVSDAERAVCVHCKKVDATGETVKSFHTC